MFSVARATWGKITRNLFWAFATAWRRSPLGGSRHLSPAIAGAAMGCRDFSVGANT